MLNHQLLKLKALTPKDVQEKETVLNNVESSTAEVECGVPQGTILGPLLFLMFINDLPLYTDNVFTDLYADDTILYQTGLSQTLIKESLQLALQRLAVWCKHN